jgi:transposase
VEDENLAESKKNANRLGAHIVFCDESGFLLIPLVLKTWAPCGKTPIHRHHYRRDKLSVISGVSVSPKRKRVGLYYAIHTKNIGHFEVCHFLRHLLRHLHGHIIVLLDNATIHKGEPMRKMIAKYRRLHLAWFPSYAPEINPDEGVWSLAKRELGNSRPENIDILINDLVKSLEGIRKSPRKLLGCIRHAALPNFLR